MLQSRPVVAKENDIVFLYQGHEQITPVQLQSGGLFHCKSGKFLHSDMMGRTLGTYVAGRSNRSNDTQTPYILMLPFSSTLWTQALPHRTQIIYDTDIAMLILLMRLSPGKRVVEAGTGSGSLTHSMAKVVAPYGTVFTCDFHKGRCLQAREEFERHFGKENTLVCSQWRDVSITSTDVDVMWTEEKKTKEGSVVIKEQEVADVDVSEENGKKFSIHHAFRVEDLDAPRAGFGLPRQSVDAVFLDIPVPWLAVDNARHILTSGGILATFSPCIEQTQRLCARLREGPNHDFVDIRTVEVLSKQFEACASYSGEVSSSSNSHSSSVANRKRSREELLASYDESCKAPAGDACKNSFGGVATSMSKVLKLRPCPISKGHSAYLTFARRSLLPDSIWKRAEE